MAEMMCSEAKKGKYKSLLLLLLLILLSVHLYCTIIFKSLMHYGTLFS